MKRRNLLKNALRFGITLAPLSRLSAAAGLTPADDKVILAGPKKPLTIYNNWSAYDELSDNIPLTEALAMKQLGEIVRLKKSGVQVDYYMMDAFWFDKTGGFRVWHKERWPNGPDEWLAACKQNDIMPGMWFSVNDRINDNQGGYFLDLIPEWKDSEATNPKKALCMFRGGYLKHFADTLQTYADKGVKAFKFDFARMGAATASAEKDYLPPQIEEMNKTAFSDALKAFRQRNPGILLVGYNGFGGEMGNTYMPYRKTVDTRWLEVFDTLYCGDPRFSDVPTGNIWRSADIYSDHMVRQYELNGLPIHRIDNCGFMIGVAGTCYKRATNAWKGMQILELARGGWVNVYHGNLELLSEKDAQWFAKTQSLYMNLQQFGATSTFGGMPGERQPYGFMASGQKGTVCTVVNPSQQVATLELPVDVKVKSAVMYADGGFKPMINANTITLGPEQLAVVGSDEYADGKYSLGIDETVRIPVASDRVAVNFRETGQNTIAGSFMASSGKDIRVLLQQFGADGFPSRSSGGSPPGGKNMDTIIRIAVSQGGKNLPLNVQHDKMIWSGLSWGAGEVKQASIKAGIPVEITCSSTEIGKLLLKAEVYAINYQ
jgi:hypothetical protein